MDFCIDCDRKLHDLFCRSCKMIYLPEVKESMRCRHCGNRMIIRGSRHRYRCEFCLHRYFAYNDYDPKPKQDLEEYIHCLEKPCPECANRMVINPRNHELVCHSCGLVYEDTIYTEL